MPRMQKRHLPSSSERESDSWSGRELRQRSRSLVRLASVHREAAPRGRSRTSSRSRSPRKKTTGTVRLREGRRRRSRAPARAERPTPGAKSRCAVGQKAQQPPSRAKGNKEYCAGESSGKSRGRSKERAGGKNSHRESPEQNRKKNAGKPPEETAHCGTDLPKRDKGGREGRCEPAPEPKAHAQREKAAVVPALAPVAANKNIPRELPEEAYAKVLSEEDLKWLADCVHDPAKWLHDYVHIGKKGRKGQRSTL